MRLGQEDRNRRKRWWKVKSRDTWHDKKTQIPLIQRPQWVSLWVWCFQSAQLRCSCYRYLHLNSEAHLDWALVEIWTQMWTMRLIYFLMRIGAVFVSGRAHLVPFFLRKEFLVLSVLLFSSRDVKPPLSRVTDSSPGVMCFPAWKEKREKEIQQSWSRKSWLGLFYSTSTNTS